MMKTMEILAPAGSREALTAAVQNGADAVYLGGTRFSARAYASNFSEATLEEAVDYCHAYGVKVYITINTLLKDAEMEEALSYAAFLYTIGVDALIVQDTGFIHRLRQRLPDFELHASTQLSIHNGEGALYFQEKGITRVVLARELTLEEIRHISRDLLVETEVFVHGALCISYSGQCLMSSILGGRSGNRGRCAQPCRLPYDLLDETGRSRAKAYLMSPKDISAVDFLEDLRDTGTTSLKIEGRMKRPEYVAATVHAIREALASGPDPRHKEDLAKVFNREGFSEGWFRGKPGKDLMAMDFPKNTGVPIGTVLEDGTLLLKKPLMKGDGLRVGESGLTVEGMEKNRQPLQSAAPGDRVTLRNRKGLAPGILFKTYDKTLMDALGSTFQDPFGRKIPVEASLTFAIGAPATLTATLDGATFTAATEVPVERAKNAPLSPDRVREALEKSKDAPFALGPITLAAFEEGFLPVKTLNQLRRSLMDQLLAHRVTRRKRVLAGSGPATPQRAAAPTALPKKLLGVLTYPQLEAALEAKVPALMVYPHHRGAEFLALKDLADVRRRHPEVSLYVKMSNIIRQEWDKVMAELETFFAQGVVDGVVTANAGVIRALRGRMPVIGDYKLNLLNSDALRFYGEDLAGSTLSEELNRSEMRQLQDKNRYMALVYGRQELMHSEYCPVGATLGGMTSKTPCNAICMKESFRLKDRMGEEFPILTDTFCRSFILNGKPKNLLGDMGDLRSLGFTHFRMDLTVEDGTAAKELIAAFLKETAQAQTEFNRGHYKRGVE